MTLVDYLRKLVRRRRRLALPPPDSGPAVLAPPPAALHDPRVGAGTDRSWRPCRLPGREPSVLRCSRR